MSNKDELFIFISKGGDSAHVLLYVPEVRIIQPQ
jgi:D-arabinose 5-phosphate isomerase GutQ